MTPSPPDKLRRWLSTSVEDKNPAIAKVIAGFFHGLFIPAPPTTPGLAPPRRRHSAGNPYAWPAAIACSARGCCGRRRGRSGGRSVRAAG